MAVGEAMAFADLFGDVPVNLGNRAPDAEPVHDVFRCAGNDTWVAVVVEDNDQLEALAGVLGLDSDETAAIEQRLADWCIDRSPSQAMEELQEVGVPAGSVTTAADRFDNAHYRARGAYVETEHPVIGWEVVYREPWTRSKPVQLVSDRAPMMGEANEYVVCELLGRSKEDFDALVAGQVLY